MKFRMHSNIGERCLRKTLLTEMKIDFRKLKLRQVF